MRKLPKRPRTFGRTKAKPYKKKQKPQMFLNERFFQALEKMCNNQGWWYIHYDEHGQHKSMGMDFGGPRKEQP